MTTPRVSTLLAALAVCTWACGPGSELEVDEEGTTSVIDEGGDDGVMSAALIPATFDIHRLLEDDDLQGHQWVTTAQVQAYLTQKGSYLAKYKDPTWNKSAAALIVERSKAFNISPVYMLARIETESSLVQSGSSAYLAQATGCGCPDGQGCSTAYKGFGNQVDCAASKLRSYYNDLDAGRTTKTGWKIGVWKTTFDPCSIKPQNNATAALYTYTPWVGSYGLQCGTSKWGGSSLVARAYHKFKSEYSWGTGTTTGGQCYSGTVDKNVSNDACVQSSSDALWRQCINGTFSNGTTTKPSNCTESWSFCQSGTLNKAVPARTCVQAAYDSQWYQCGQNGVFVSAPTAGSTGTGPVGTCYQMYPR